MGNGKERKIHIQKNIGGFALRSRGGIRHLSYRVCSFSIGVSRRYTKSGEQPQSDFINIVAWRSTAEFIAKYFRKGSAICICGSLQTRSWTANDGSKRYATEVVADEASFVERKNDSARSDDYQAPVFTAGGAETPKFEEIAGDDDLPF